MEPYLGAGSTQAYNSSLLVAGTTTTLTTTVILQYAIRGKVLNMAVLTNSASPTTDIITGAAFLPIIGGGSVANVPGNGCVFLVGVNAAGAVKVAQGKIERLDMQTKFVIAPQFPAIPADFCPFAYIIVTAGNTASAAGWVFGVNNWAGVTGVTATFVNLVTLPDRPQVA